MRTNPLFDFSELTPAERMQLAVDLWDSLDEEELDAALPLTAEQIAELERRLEEADHHPDSGVPWGQTRAEIENRLRAVREPKGRRGA